MITIENNSDDSFTAIRAIAKEVWPIAYGAILSREQLDYMMEMMYSIDSLREQVSLKKHYFILAVEAGKAVGFASFELNCNGVSKTKIHKIYILSTEQGKGIGKVLIHYIQEKAIEEGQGALLLNVNRNNKALYFYENLGFRIQSQEDISIGNGYLMEDYVMEKAIQKTKNHGIS